MSGEREHIGGGVYAEVWEGMLRLTTNRGNGQDDDVLFFDSLSCISLVNYIESLHVIVPPEPKAIT